MATGTEESANDHKDNELPAAVRPTPERFLPQRVRALQQALLSRPWNDAGDAARFSSFARIVAALFHYEFHEREQAVLDAWEAMGDDPAAATAVTAERSGVRDGANFT